MSRITAEEMLREVEQVTKSGDRLHAINQLSALLQLYRCDYYSDLWNEAATLYSGFSQSLIGVGLLGSAFRLAYEGSRKHESFQLLNYLCALSLARMGDVRKAEAHTDRLNVVNEPSLRIDVLSLRARLFKDRHVRTLEPGRKRDYAHRAAEMYHSAFQQTQSAYPAINAATMFLIVGDYDDAQRLAKEALERTTKEMTPESDHWAHATVAESLFILGEFDDACASYQTAVRLAAGRMSDVASMQKNARILSDSMQAGADVLDVFGTGCVATCLGSNPLGHLTATSNSESQNSAQVRSQIRQWIQQHGVGVGYCCPRPGVETIFGEEVRAIDGELHVVLPYSKDEFLRMGGMHQRAADGHSWRDHSKQLIDEAAGQNRLHFSTSERFLSEPLLVEYSDTVMHGLAVSHAERISVKSATLALIDTTATAASEQALIDMEKRWKPRGTHWHRLQLQATEDRRPAPWTVKSGRELKAMLFADLKNFSTLPEYASSAFCRDFNQLVYEIIKSSAHKPRFQNSWGDGLYFVFDGVADAAHFAVALLDRFKDVKFDEEFGLPGLSRPG